MGGGEELGRMGLVVLGHLTVWSILVCVLHLSHHDRLFFKTMMVLMVLYFIVTFTVTFISEIKTVAIITTATTSLFLLVEVIYHTV